MLTIMRRLEVIDLSRPAALLRLPQPGRSCQPDIAVAVSTTIDPLAGDRGFESTSLPRGVRCELAEPAAVYGFKAATRHKRQPPKPRSHRRPAFSRTNASARAAAPGGFALPNAAR